jgi:TRIAD3 protein (E3 ubiquitin-protein ligase RNF216)
MAQCTDTHLFCTSCVTSYASAKLGEQSSDLRCMDISGCKMAFPDSELRRVLPRKLFELYEHIRQRREIELAGIEGLEECPFCDYKVVLDVDFETDKVFRCQNFDCSKVSCRKCKKEVSIRAMIGPPFWGRLLSMVRITCRNPVKVCTSLPAFISVQPPCQL